MRSTDAVCPWTLAETPEAPNRGGTQVLSTTGRRRLGTHEHSSSIPAVVTARPADAAAVACCQTKPSPLLHTYTHKKTLTLSNSYCFHHMGDKLVKLLLPTLQLRLVRSHSHITTAPATPRARSLPVAMATRGGSSPVRSGRMVSPQLLGVAWCCLSFMRLLSNEFTRR